MLSKLTSWPTVPLRPCVERGKEVITCVTLELCYCVHSPNKPVAFRASNTSTKEVTRREGMEQANIFSISKPYDDPKFVKQGGNHLSTFRDSHIP